MDIAIIYKVNQEAQADQTEKNVKIAAGNLNIQVEVTKTTNLAQFPDVSVNVSQTPIVIVNKEVVYAGSVPQIPFLTGKLNELRDGGGTDMDMI